MYPPDIPIAGEVSSFLATISPPSDNTSVTIVNIDDSILEATEVLLVAIESTDPSITVGMENSTFALTVLDDEGKAVVSSVHGMIGQAEASPVR